MKNNQNDLVKRAIEKIKCDEKCKPNCCAIIGSTGPAGPAGATALTITPSAGGTRPVSAHLVIIQLQW